MNVITKKELENIIEQVDNGTVKYGLVLKTKDKTIFRVTNGSPDVEDSLEIFHKRRGGRIGYVASLNTTEDRFIDIKYIEPTYANLLKQLEHIIVTQGV